MNFSRGRRGRGIKFLAGFFGLGYSPIAPGTAGAAGGVGGYLLLRYFFPGFVPESWAGLGIGYLLFLAIFFLVGVQAATRAEREWRQRDDHRIVIDEAFSVFITFLALPVSPLLLAAGFILNRFFDVAKPFPARRLEKIPAGWGVMLDDLLAGIYSRLALALLMAGFGHLGV
jgi:phosphatidylglycerophosphatase A